MTFALELTHWPASKNHVSSWSQISYRFCGKTRITVTHNVKKKRKKKKITSKERIKHFVIKKTFNIPTPKEKKKKFLILKCSWEQQNLLMASFQVNLIKHSNTKVKTINHDTCLIIIYTRMVSVILTTISLQDFSSFHYKLLFCLTYFMIKRQLPEPFIL